MHNKTIWVDGVTNLSAQNLNNIENGIVKNEVKTIIPNPTIKTGDDVVKNLLKWNKDQSYFEKDECGMPYDGADIVQLGKFYSVGAFSVSDIGYRLYRQEDGTISTTTRTSEYYIGWVLDENTAYIGVEGGQAKGYVSGPSKLIAEVILDVETTSIVIDDLDINADGGIYDFWVCSTSNGAATIKIYINTDDTPANYYMQYVEGSGSSVRGTRATSPGVCPIYTQTTAVGNIIRNPVTGHALCRSDAIYRGGSDLTIRSSITSSVNTFTNITKLTFTTLYGFDVGTTLKIYKR